jgi:hypothetical protein
LDVGELGEKNTTGESCRMIMDPSWSCLLQSICCMAGLDRDSAAECRQQARLWPR